ncbi:uncharacterized protein LOC131258278 [Magnolia sinica]|uniref:uncharacterized protein LOC131258278 n=1 Tax=Magnolia sinica TaxID=86752 RepID=UPI002658CF07|nr:uncharacterized protein LOC131258278 [Magnolia sinica]
MGGLDMDAWRRLPTTNSNAAAHQKPAEEESKENTTPHSNPLYPSSSAYTQGVLRSPPRSLFFASNKEEAEQLECCYQPSTSLHLIGLISTSPQTQLPPLLPCRSPPFQKKSTSLQVEIEAVEEEYAGIGSDRGSGAAAAEHFVCISNPIYDGEAWIESTPFQTPDTSPSHLEREDCSDMEENAESMSPPSACVFTPPLTPMKKLPVNAASVTLMDSRSLVASVSGGTTDSNVASSSTSGSPCTSPSW